MTLSPTTLYTAATTISTNLVVDSSGNIYFGAGTSLYGIDSSGNNLTGYPIVLGIQTQDIGILNDFIYIAISTTSVNNGIVKKYNSSGTLQWTTTINRNLLRIYISDRVYVSNDIFGAGLDSFFGLNISTGTSEKTYNVCNDSWQCRLIDNSTYIYALTNDGGGSACTNQIRRYNKETTVFINKFTTTGGLGFTGSIKDTSDNIYFGNQAGNFYKVSSDLGTVLTFLTGGAVGSTATINEPRVYFGSNDNKIYCLQTTDLSLNWSFTTSGDIVSKPVIVSNNLYVGSVDTKLYKLDLSGNLIDSSNALAGAINQDLYLKNNKVYIPAGTKIYYITLPPTTIPILSKLKPKGISLSGATPLGKTKTTR